MSKSKVPENIWVNIHNIQMQTYPNVNTTVNSTANVSLKPEVMGLDFETFSTVDLRKHGLDRYATDSSTVPLIASTYNPTLGTRSFSFIDNYDNNVRKFVEYLYAFVWSSHNCFISAHNAGFERAILRNMGGDSAKIEFIVSRIVDSAVVARCMGASSHLEAAAPQLTQVEKLETGSHLIRVFSIPNDVNEGKPITVKKLAGDTQLLRDWKDFQTYCEQDALASREIVVQMNALQDPVLRRELIDYEPINQKMNDIGWNVDLDVVAEMKVRYERNVEEALRDFQARVDPDLNLNSPQQLKRWCADRHIKATGFDADKVSQLLGKLERGLLKIKPDDPKRPGYEQVLEMLRTKQILGGTSLKKLQVILDTVGLDGRLRNQYMHCGAGQTYRTSGKGVQMQNLKKLSSDALDMETIEDQSLEFSNDELAANLRQVFRASSPTGRMIVGDFSAVESRGLAFLAGEEYKLQAYREGKDIYKVLASRFSGVPYEAITKEARAEGKYSELSCGYQAGPKVVQDFMHRLGFDIPLEGEGGATQRVMNWREANPNIVHFWSVLNDLLHEALSSTLGAAPSRRNLANGLTVQAAQIYTPKTLTAQHPGAKSIEVSLYNADGYRILQRVFHGCYLRDRSICYYKPSDRKTGDLWKGSFVHPKTKQMTFYSIYGGKLAGILTQSLCREIFMYVLRELSVSFQGIHNVSIVGQFHDEIVVEWEEPIEDKTWITLQGTIEDMEVIMSAEPSWLPGFPLSSEIKSDYRYTK